MLRISIWRPPGNHFPASAPTCSESVSGGLLGASLGPAPKNAQNHYLEACWGPFWSRRPKMLGISIWRLMGDILGQAQKCSESPSGGLLGAILGPAPKNAQNQHLEASREPFWSQRPKMLKICLPSLPKEMQTAQESRK
jgi:hypothetical protein